MKQEEQPKFAILLAAFNGEKYIEAQINSIINQINVNCSIFISIDQSNDNTEKICQKIEGGNVKILKRSESHFGSAGKNFYRLFREVEFEGFDYIALSDQDDIWKKDKLIRAHKKILENNASAYSSDVECFWEDGRSNKIIRKSYPQKHYDYYFEPAGPGCTYVLKKKLADAVKEEILKNSKLPFHHDWLIYAFARKNNFIWHIDNYPSILYRQHSSNQVGANSGIKAYKKRIDLLKNGVFKAQVIEICELTKKDYSSIRKDLIKNPLNYRRKKTEAILLLFAALLKWI